MGNTTVEYGIAVDTAMPYNSLDEAFLESPIFSKFVYDYLTDEEYAAVQQEIMDRLNDPVIPRSGGVRKKRWAQPGRGKRGGVRIIYYVKK